MKLYVIRHGESQANVEHVYCGQMDSPLTALGRQQAKQAGKFLKGIPFDKVYSSPLSRAVDTAKLALPEFEPETDPDLMEISVGELTDLNYFNCAKELGEDFLRHRAAWDFTPYGGENRQMIMERTARFLEKVKNGGHECVAAFCHAGASCAILMSALGFPLNRYSLSCNNTSIAVFEYETDHWTLKKWNFDGTV